MENKLNEFSYKKEFDTVQLKNETTINIADMGSILSVTAESIILGTEVLNGEVRFNGEVCYMVIYNDTNGSIKSQRSFKEFEGKITDDSITTITKVILKSNISDCGYGISGDNQITLESVLSVEMMGFITSSYREIDEKDTINQKSTITTSYAYSSGETRINLEESFSLKEKPQEILSTYARLIPRSYQTGTGYVEYDAQLVLWVIYLYKRDDKSELRSELLTRNIKEEVEISDSKKESSVIINLSIKNCSIETTIDTSQIKTNIPIDVKYILFNQSQKEVIVDAFSPDYETQLTYDTITILNKMDKYFLSERVNGEIEFDEDHTRINRILCNDNNRVVITSKNISDNLVKVDGIITGNIVYQLDDDNGTISSVKTEIPFSVNLDIGEIKADDFVDISVDIIDFTTRLKKGRTIECDVELGFSLNILGQTYDSIIKNIDMVSPVEKDNLSNFFIYFARSGDTLWDICKKLKVSEEDILLKNQDLVFPLVTDKAIVIYKQLEMK